MDPQGACGCPEAARSQEARERPLAQPAWGSGRGSPELECMSTPALSLHVRRLAVSDAE